METYKVPTTPLLETEELVIISSIARCFSKQDIRYLLPPAYNWLITCGMPSHDRLSNFTKTYRLFPVFAYDFYLLKPKLINLAVEGTRYYAYFEQREAMYNSILRIIKKEPIL